MRWPDALRTAWTYGPLCADLASFHRLRALRDHYAGADLVSIRLRPLQGRAITCRPQTTDFEVLRDTFLAPFHLPPADLHPRTILDLGSNIGTTLAHFAVTFPDARILGVELDAGNAALCRQNVASYQHVTLLQGAAWIHDGVIPYGGGFGEFGFRVGSPQTIATVPAYSLKTLVARLGGSVDFLKMDIEGAEAQILSQPDPIWARIAAIKVEIHEPYTCEQGTTDLEARGFRVTRDPAHRSALLGRRH